MSSYDLVVVSADLDIQEVMLTLLSRRTDALGIRRPKVNYLKHSGRDSGCFDKPDRVLVSSTMARHALVVFDCAFGGSALGPEEMAQAVERKLAPVWGNRARAVAIHPEVEAWLWEGHHVVDALRWNGNHPALRAWLAAQGLWDEASAKPSDPKEALDRVAKHTSPGVRREVFEYVAGRASVERCTDPSFLRLRSILREWFPA